MTTKKKSIFIIAGEASGDIHGANLVTSIKTLNPNIDITAWGGDKMNLAGATILKHYKELAFMGFWEVMVNIKAIFSNFKLIKKQVKEINPNLIVLIDYPGFNLRMAKWFKKNNFKVIYYIAPQAWAWKENRVIELQKYTDELLVILPFELSFFSKRGVNTTFVGHPLIDELKKKEISTIKEKKVVLMPGSRKQEISNILPIMLTIVPFFPQYTFVLAGMSHIGTAYYDQFIDNCKVNILWDNSFDALNGATAALVSSGTATLETALMGIPQVVCYRSSYFNYQIGKRLINVPYVSLVNLILDQPLLTELIQHHLNTENLKRELSLIIENTNRRDEIIDGYRSLQELLSQSKASTVVANKILEYL